MADREHPLHTRLRLGADALVYGVATRGEAYVRAMVAAVEMGRRQVQSTINMAELHRLADIDAHPLLTARESRELAHKWQHRAWIQREAYTRLATIARRRLVALNDYAVKTASEITDELRKLEGMHITKENPFK